MPECCGILHGSSSDDEIRRFAAARNTRGLPKFSVPLGFAISPTDPDVATVHFDLPGRPVDRTRSATPGRTQ